MTPLFKFSLLGLGAASAGGGVICISKREAIREYFRGPSNQTPAGSGEKLPTASGVHSQDTSTKSSTTNTQGTDLNNRGQDSNQGETRSPVPGEDQVDGSKDPVVTEDQKVNGASETAKSPQDLQQPDAPRDPSQDRRDLPNDDQHQAPTVQDLQQQQPPGAPSQDRGNLTDNLQLPSGGLESREEDPNPGKPQGQEGESVQGPKVVGGDAGSESQKPREGEDPVPGPAPTPGVGGDPKVNPRGQDSNPSGGSQRAGEGVNHVPVPGPGGAPGSGREEGSDPNTIHQGGEPSRDRVDPAPGSRVPGPAPSAVEQTDPNVTPQSGVPSPDGTGQPVVKGPGVVGPTEDDGSLPGQEKVPGGGLDEHSSSNNAKGGPGAGGGGGSLPKGEGAQINQGSGVSEPGAGGLPGPGEGDAPTGPSPEGHTPKEPSNPLPAADTTDYQCLFGEGDYSTTNKKAIKDFLLSTPMKGNQGVQIHDDNYEKGFKCAKDMEDEKLAGLKDYMDTVKNSFSAPNTKGGNEPMVWAFKKNNGGDNNGWTMYEDDANVDSEDLTDDDDKGGILIAKTAKS